MTAAAGRSAAPPQGVLLIGLAVFAVGLATTIPLPLYGAYAARGGHGAGALALAFAAYAITLILTAPLLGPLPDRIGRRRCVLLGLVLAAFSTLALLMVPTIPMLAAARVAQGIGMGCATGAAAAWAAELSGGGPAGGRRAAAVIAAATIGSFGLGGVLTLVALWAEPATLRPPTFPAHLLLVGVLLWPVARLPETLAAPQPGWLRWPAFPRGTWATTLAILPGWGTTGTVLTSGQAVLATQGLPLAGPLAACAMMAVGVAAQRLFARVAPRRAVRIGLLGLVAAAAVTFFGAASGALMPLLIGAVAIGIAVYGFVYLGGLAAVAEAASGEDRARAVAGYFVVAHIGFSAVPLLAGLAVDAFGAVAALAGLWGCLAIAAGVLAGALGRAQST
jgi:predicted MFS family arabinose efflux permease